MSELTPRNAIPYPSEREEPFYDTARGGYIAEDSIHYANSENGNLVYFGGGTFSWNATTNLLTWTASIYVSGFSTPWRAVIAGPGTVEIQQSEVVYFKMPRLIEVADQAIPTLYRSNRVFVEGVRLNDLRLFVTRVDDTLFFVDGKSMEDGDVGPLFGTGLGAPPITYIPHEHAAAALVTPPGGTTVLTPSPLYIAPQLVRIDLFKNGQLLTQGVDYTVNLVAGTATLVVASTPGDRYVFFRELRDFSHVYTTHTHAVKLDLTPVAGTTMLNALATAPSLTRVDVFRNGQLLTEGGGFDYTIDLSTGIITLALPSVAADVYEIWRQLAI